MKRKCKNPVEGTTFNYGNLRRWIYVNLPEYISFSYSSLRGMIFDLISYFGLHSSGSFYLINNQSGSHRKYFSKHVVFDSIYFVIFKFVQWYEQNIKTKSEIQTKWRDYMMKNPPTLREILSDPKPTFQIIEFWKTIDPESYKEKKVIINPAEIHKFDKYFKQKKMLLQNGFTTDDNNIFTLYQGDIFLKIDFENDQISTNSTNPNFRRQLIKILWGDRPKLVKNPTGENMNKPRQRKFDTSCEFCNDTGWIMSTPTPSVRESKRVLCRNKHCLAAHLLRKSFEQGSGLPFKLKKNPKKRKLIKKNKKTHGLAVR